MTTLGDPFTVLESVDSTNNYAMAQVSAGLATHGAAFFTGQQTAGKGQRNKSWNSGIDENLALSIVVEPGLAIHEQFYFSAAIALASYDLVKIEAGAGVSIKWPNDIYWRDKKAAGILIENKLKGAVWTFSIVGIGLNLNQLHFDPALVNPVSLSQVSGKTYDLLHSARQLCTCVDNRFRQLHERNKPAILEEYNSVLYKKGELIRLIKDGTAFETIVQGVNESGQLVTGKSPGQTFTPGEIQWVHD